MYSLVMKCPSCNFQDTKVVDSRSADNNASTRRRRECESCQFRFTTFEKALSTKIVVIKKDGSSEPYDRSKLEKAILVACGKRPVSLEKIRENLSDLENKWATGKGNSIKSSAIGKDIVELLRTIDEVAFIRFASVYKQFKDVETFKKELDKIL